MLRGTRYHFFKKIFPKIDFVKTVSVTIIANSKKMKMKKITSLYELCIASGLALLVSPTHF